MNIKLKKSMKIVYICIFFIICVIPFIFMFISKKDNSNSTENRTLSEMPSLILDNGSINTSFGVDTETYMSEHMGFRNSLINLNNTLYYNIFNQSMEDDVIVGNNGWLYYSQTLDDYLGRDMLSNKDISCIVKTLELQQEYVQSYGGNYIFTVAPNKNTLYPEGMPSRYIKESTENNLSKLTTALENSTINYCNLKDVLSQDDSILYHKKDTHWNNHGALIGYNTLLDYANIVHDNYSNVAFSSEKTWNGDLDGMLFPNNSNLDYQIEYDIDFNYQYTSRLRTSNLDDISITTSNEQANGSLLLFRDSFGRALIPFMAEAFNSAEFSRAFPYNIVNTQADLVIQEIVERNIDTLINSAPIMFAPERSNIDISYNDSLLTDSVIQSTSNDSLDATKIFGKISCDVSNYNDFNIYVVVDNSKVFEAFPIFEQELLSSYSLNDNEVGFSLLISNSYIDISKQNVCVMVYQDGKAIAVSKL